MHKQNHIFTPLLLLWLTLNTLSAWAQAPVINIIHTNDTHSQIEPEKGRQGEMLGGVVERAAMIGLFRNEDPELLYLDAGDMVQGSPYFNVFKGEVEILCMNQQQLAATTFGNHEFDNGIDFLKAMRERADFPLVSCNYHCEKTPLSSLIVPHVIMACHGVKVGITGVTVNPGDLIFGRHWQGITFEDPRTAVSRETELLRNEGCDLVIVLSHLGYQPTPTTDENMIYDGDLVSATRGIDIIIGGHTHTNIEEGVYVNDLDGHPVLITQTGGKGSPIGHLKITMKEGSRYEGCRYSIDSIVCHKLHPADYDLTPYGQEMSEFIAPYKESLQNQMNVRVGYAPVSLDRKRPQPVLGNFTADAFRIMGEQYTGRKMDLGLMNIGGLRADLNEGNVTLGTLFSIYPFENTLTIVDLKGDELTKLVQSNAGRKLDAWSGLKVTLEMEGDKVIAKDVTVDGQPIDPERVYTIATIDYLAEGNSGMSALTRCVSSQNTGILLRDVMIEYVKQLEAANQPVMAERDDRIIDNTHSRMNDEQ